MTDAHCHVSCGDASVREFVVGRDFFGVHPWEAVGQTDFDVSSIVSSLRTQLISHPDAGVGEVGLDRLKDRTVSAAMRAIFEAQLGLAIELRRPVVLHGAKCWGQVVETVRRFVRLVGEPNPARMFLFHGFSRSDGLIPDIVALNGYISVGPAILNDHAVNYRKLARKIPADRLLVETDRTEENAAECPHVRDVLAKLAETRGDDLSSLVAQTDANADRFLGMQ
jgi:TatD DNase family protein